MSEQLIYKNYRIVPLGTYAMFKILPPGSGKIPASLEGLFTKKELAIQAVDMYLEGLLKKRSRQDGSKTGPGTS